MTTAAVVPGLVRELSAIVRSGQVLDNPAQLQSSAVDGITPRVVVSPGSVGEVAALLKFAHDAGLVVVPAGGFTQQHTGSSPERIDIVLRTDRLDAVEHYDPGDLTIGIGAGASLSRVDNIIAPHHQLFPLDAPLPDSSTIGGALATAAHGPLKHGYGGVRDYCTGIRYVTVDGKFAKAGARVVKNVAGYDMMKLLIGSWGTIGVIVGASFKLFPRPRQTRTFLCGYSSLADALKLRDAILQSPLSPMCVELLSPHARVLLSAEKEELQPVWWILVRAAGSDTLLARYRAELDGAVTGEIVGEAESLAWRRIADFPEAAFRRSHNAMVLRVDVPAQSVGPMVGAAERAAVDNNFVCAVVGRIGLGTLLVSFIPVAVDPPAVIQYVNTVSSVRASLSRDGSAVVLRCPVEVKRHISVWGTSPTDLDCMRVIKRAMDPNDILNRGRFVV